MKLQLFVTILSLFAFILFAGCGSKGPDVNFVEGTVVYDDQPLTNAAILFHPKDESQGTLPAVGRTDVKGYYKLTSLQGGAHGKGATGGEYAISLERFLDGDENANNPRSLIPQRYTEVKTSPLTFTVTKGKNRFDINIDKK